MIYTHKKKLWFYVWASLCCIRANFMKYYFHLLQFYHNIINSKLYFCWLTNFPMAPKKWTWTIFMYLANGTDRNDENANKIEKKIAKTLQVVRCFYVLVLVCAWKTNFQMPVTVTYKSHTHTHEDTAIIIITF